MSTRANIVVIDKETWTDSDNKVHTHTEKLFFYRHSDGYPEGMLPLLNKAMEGIQSGILRNNVPQFSGWLILLGAVEYDSVPRYPDVDRYEYSKRLDAVKFNIGDTMMGWKVGSIEPTTHIHGDIQYLYVIDLNKKEIRYMQVEYGVSEKTSISQLIKRVMQKGTKA